MFLFRTECALHPEKEQSADSVGLPDGPANLVTERIGWSAPAAS